MGQVGENEHSSFDRDVHGCGFPCCLPQWISMLKKILLTLFLPIPFLFVILSSVYVSNQREFPVDLLWFLFLNLKQPTRTEGGEKLCSIQPRSKECDMMHIGFNRMIKSKFYCKIYSFEEHQGNSIHLASRLQDFL